jgi:ketosteroid isomerase-like protein
MVAGKNLLPAGSPPHQVSRRFQVPVEDLLLLPGQQVAKRGSRGSASAALLLVALGLGCERAENTTAQPDTAALRAAVDSTMVDHFRAFEQGDMVRWSRILAEDVHFVQADPANVFASRDSARRKMEQDIGQVREMGIKLEIRPLNHWTWLASTGRAAGTTYDLQYEASYQNQRYSYRLRASYLLEEDSNEWKVCAAHYSSPIMYDTLFMALAQNRIQPLAGVAGQAPSGLDSLLLQFRSDLRDISTATIAANATVVSPGAIVQGGENGRRELAQWLGPAGSAAEHGGGIRGGVDESETIGWVAANLRVPVFAGPESAVAPMRALFAYRRTGSRWEIVQVSLSVGLRESSR